MVPLTPRLLMAAALALAAPSAPIAAEPVPPPAAVPAEPAADLDDGSAVVEALEVEARPPGPALWKAKRGDAEVVILGGTTPLPHALVWDTVRIERALEGAQQVLTPPKATAGVLDVPGLLLKLRKLRQPSGHRLEADLPPELAARFAKAREAIGKPADRYAKWKPAAAGILLLNDHRSVRGLSSAKPGSTVAKLAEARHAKVRPMAELKLSRMVSSALNLSPRQEEACLAKALDQVDYESGEGPARFQAWADGDLRAFRATRPSLPMEDCLAELKGYSAMLEEATSEATSSMTAVLAKPGRTVAVLDLSLLLRPDGVLDRLRASGAEISTPP